MARRSAAPTFEVDEIQGDILPGFKKDHRAFLFARIRDVGSARKVLGELAPQIATCGEVLAFNSLRKQLGLHRTEKRRLVATWVNVAFTSDGLRRLLGDGADELGDDSFATGLLPDDHRSEPDAFLGDPSKWIIGSNGREPHVLLNVAGDVPALLEEEVDRLRSLLTGTRAFELCYEDRGDAIAIRPGTEHFGFVDGIATPYFCGFPGNPVGVGSERSAVSLGRVLVGDSYEDSTWQPVLPPAPAWMTNGSFMVWLRLEQDVPAFWRFCVAGARRATTEWSAGRRLITVSPDDFAALLIGRRRDAIGTPLARCPFGSPPFDLPLDLSEEELSKALNDYSYREATPKSGRLEAIPADPLGLRCPLSAHIRKTNPRLSEERGRIIVRRGIPYGPPVIDLLHPTSTECEQQRGLHFVCYQRSIVEQFEHIRRNWADAQGAPDPLDGVDPLIGAPAFTDDVDLVLPAFNRPGSTMIGLLNRWVKVTGGAYFFVPSIAALERVLAA